MTRSFRRAHRLAALLCVLLVGASAEAQDKKACQASFEAVQTLRDSGKPIEALAEAARCASVCSKEPQEKYFADRCTKWAPDLRDGLPTVVFDVKDDSGAPATSVKISVDGKVVADKLDGTDVPIDPGPHAIRFDLGGGKTKDIDVLIKAGEKRRSIIASFETTKPSPPPPPSPSAAPLAPAASPQPPPSDASPRTSANPGVPTWAWVVGGVGAASTIAAVVFATQWAGAHSDFNAGVCGGSKPGPTCNDIVSRERLDEGLTLGLGGIGLLGLALGSYGVVIAPSKSASAPHARLMPIFGGGSSGVAVSGIF